MKLLPVSKYLSYRCIRIPIKLTAVSEFIMFNFTQIHIKILGAFVFPIEITVVIQIHFKLTAIISAYISKAYILIRFPMKLSYPNIQPYLIPVKIIAVFGSLSNFRLYSDIQLLVARIRIPHALITVFRSNLLPSHIFNLKV